MSSPITPLTDRVVAVHEQTQTKTASGIYLPGAAKEKPVVAVVQAVGPDVKSVKKGDRILHNSFGFEEFKIDGIDYLIIKEADILATV